MKITIEADSIVIENGPTAEGEEGDDFDRATMAFLLAMTWAAERLIHEVAVCTANHQAVHAIKAARAIGRRH